MRLKQNNKPFDYQTDFADCLSKATEKDLDAYARDLVDRFPEKAVMLEKLLGKALNNRRFNLEKLYR